MAKKTKTLKTPQKRIPLGSKKTGRIGKKSYYESPLKHIQLSAKRWMLKQAQRKMIRKETQLAKKRRSLLSPKKRKSLQDSVIILSDNESEGSDEEVSDNCATVSKTNTNDLCVVGSSNDASIIVIEPLRALSTEDEQTTRCLRSSTKLPNTPKLNSESRNCKKRKRSSIKPVNNNTSCLIISDAEDSDNLISNINVDGENIAPVPNSQGSDEIVVVWSSAKDSPLENTEASEDQVKEHEPERHESDDRLFMVDCSPNPRNLRFLESTEPTAKRKKVVSEERSEDSTDLPFSKEGLKFPKARNFTRRIPRTKVKSIAKPFKILQKQTSVSATTTSSTTSAVTSTTNTDVTNSENTLVPSETKLRVIVIDGNNIAMAYTLGQSFSEKGLKIVIDYFQNRGHTVKAFVPQHRRSTSRPLLEQLYVEGTVVFTPSRRAGNKRITPYDDRFILEYATVCDGIVVSSDQYRDLYLEKPEWRNTIANRLLAPTFVGDYVMFPEDPLGRGGPRLEEFLRC